MNRVVGSSFWCKGEGDEIEVWRPDLSPAGARLYRGIVQFKVSEMQYGAGL